MTVRVLVVEDEQLAAEAHATYTNRVEGFEVAAVARSAGEAARALAADPTIDLVLLDMHLPDGHGLGLLQRLRAAGHLCDVIAVTSARDLTVVRAAVSVGVVQYLLKPFTFASLRDKLERYARFRESAARSGEVTGQAEVDGMLATLRTPDQQALPKGLSGETLQAITDALSEAADGLSAAAAADLTGVSRVTARRYLEYLADNGLALRKPNYGQVGRPEVRFVTPQGDR